MTILIGAAIMPSAVILETVVTSSVNMFIGVWLMIDFSPTFAANAAPMLVTEAAYPPYCASMTSLSTSQRAFPSFMDLSLSLSQAFLRDCGGPLLVIASVRRNNTLRLHWSGRGGPGAPCRRDDRPCASAALSDAAGRGNCSPTMNWMDFVQHICLLEASPG
jgi:hypothetical protein